MSCFSLAAIESLLIWAVVFIAIIGIVRLVIPAVATALGASIPDWLAQSLKIILIAAFCIFVIVVFFWLLSCVWTSLPHMR